MLSWGQVPVAGGSDHVLEQEEELLESRPVRPRQRQPWRRRGEGERVEFAPTARVAACEKQALFRSRWDPAWPAGSSSARLRGRPASPALRPRGSRCTQDRKQRQACWPEPRWPSPLRGSLFQLQG